MQIRILKHDDGSRTVVVKPSRGSRLAARQAHVANERAVAAALEQLTSEVEQEREQLRQADRA